MTHKYLKSHASRPTRGRSADIHIEAQGGPQLGKAAMANQIAIGTAAISLPTDLLSVVVSARTGTEKP
jgi:hypothetical protein